MRRARGFTLVEVLVALMIVSIALAALMVAVSGTARTSGYLRDKTLAQWIALNRLSEVRLNVNKFGQNTDLGELNFAGRIWHYDTRYFDTSIATMKRVVVRVYEGNTKAKGNPVAESTSFLGMSLGAPGQSNIDWAQSGQPGQPGQPGQGAPGQITPTRGAPGTPTAPNTAPPTTGQAPLQ